MESAMTMMQFLLSVTNWPEMELNLRAAVLVSTWRGFENRERMMVSLGLERQDLCFVSCDFDFFSLEDYKF